MTAPGPAVVSFPSFGRGQNSNLNSDRETDLRTGFEPRPTRRSVLLSTSRSATDSTEQTWYVRAAPIGFPVLAAYSRTVPRDGPVTCALLFRSSPQQGP